MDKKTLLMRVHLMLILSAIVIGCMVILAGCDNKNTQPEEPKEKYITCTIEDVDIVDATKTTSHTSVGVVGGEPGIMIGNGGSVPDVKYFVYLKTDDGQIVQFGINSNTYMAMKKMVGQEITVLEKQESFPLLGFDYITHTWQGQLLSDPIQIAPMNTTESGDE